MKNILLVGNGGREHAIAHSIYNSKSFRKGESKIYCTLGSGGLDKFCEPIEIKPTEIQELKEFALDNEIDFTVVGPEVPLSMGIVDEFEKAGLKIFGPNKKAAQIESSKIFAKDLMMRNNIPTAKYKKFGCNDAAAAMKYLDGVNFPVVIKADGLAAGKGVVVCNSRDEAVNTIDMFTKSKVFGSASDNFIIEEFLTGFEVSVLAVTDGEFFVMLPASQDHKRIGEGDTGANTGGMGAYAPLSEKLIDEELLQDIRQLIIEPMLAAFKKDRIVYKGCLYCGLMITDDKKPYVIEFNCRFGDPETQAVLPLLKSDFLKLLEASEAGTIKDYELELKPAYSFCVVLASKGYPGEYQKGFKIDGLDINQNDVIVFQAGTKIKNGDVVTSGGRVICVTAVSGESLKDAAEKAYKAAGKINFENKYFRRDIGNKSLSL